MGDNAAMQTFMVTSVMTQVATLRNQLSVSPADVQHYIVYRSEDSAVTSETSSQRSAAVSSTGTGARRQRQSSQATSEHLGEGDGEEEYMSAEEGKNMFLSLLLNLYTFIFV